MGSKWPSRRPGPQSPCQGRAPLRTPAGAGGLMKGCDLGSCPRNPPQGATPYSCAGDACSRPGATVHVHWARDQLPA